MSDRKRWARWWVVCWNKKRGWLNIWIGRLLDGIRRPLDCVHTHNRQLRSSDTFPYTHRERNEDLFIPAGSTDVRSIESNEYHHQKVFFFCFFCLLIVENRNEIWIGMDRMLSEWNPHRVDVEWKSPPTPIFDWISSFRLASGYRIKQTESLSHNIERCYMTIACPILCFKTFEQTSPTPFSDRSSAATVVQFQRRESLVFLFIIFFFKGGRWWWKESKDISHRDGLPVTDNNCRLCVCTSYILSLSSLLFYSLRFTIITDETKKKRWKKPIRARLSSFPGNQWWCA